MGWKLFCGAKIIPGNFISFNRTSVGWKLTFAYPVYESPRRFNRTSVGWKRGTKEKLKIKNDSFNRTSVGWKRAMWPANVILSMPVLIEPVWDGNSSSSSSHSTETLVLIEPVWDGNLPLRANLESVLLIVLIEPVWDGNPRLAGEPVSTGCRF